MYLEFEEKKGALLRVRVLLVGNTADVYIDLDAAL
jgi:hypothetical protein